VWALIGVLAALALALAVRTRLAAVRARRLERQRGELLADVGLLQAALLPTPPARLGPVGASVAYRPADGPGAGGDFYDVFALDDGRVGVIVGDISGHGRPALPHTALVRYTLRAYLEAGLSPREAVRTAGSVLERQLAGSFATVLLATYHPRERTLTYACAGHPPPLVLGGVGFGRAFAPGSTGPARTFAPTAPGTVRPLPPVTAGAAPPLGAGMRTGTRQSVVSIPGRAHLCFYTDGLTEARIGDRGELFGDERLARAVSELGSTSTAPALLDRVAQQTSSRPDDMACCLLTVEGGQDPPVSLIEEALLGAAELDADIDSAASERTARFLLACGAEPVEIPELMRSAAALADRSGAVLVEVDRHAAAGRSRVAFRPDNVAPLRAPSVAAVAAGR
jgi:Stage II sporulation protein E (SpoIIE)